VSRVYIAGLDLGPPGEFTALAVVERAKGVSKQSTYDYAVRHLERFAPGTPFTLVGDRVAAIFATPSMHRGQLVIDQTGVGTEVGHLFCHQSIDAKLHAVIVTNGLAHEMGAHGIWRVPKMELVSLLQVLLQTRRLMVASELAEAATLVKELTEFRAKLPTKGGEDLADWRERPHDDLVLSVAVAVWVGEHACREMDMAFV